MSRAGGVARGSPEAGGAGGRRRLRWAALLVALLAGAGSVPGCGGGPESPGPSPTATPLTPPPLTPPDFPEVAGVTRGATVGETGIRLTAAEPLPGATLTGCGAGASGCDGRIRMTLRLESAAGGPTLGLVAFLHSDRAVACFRADVAPFDLAPGAARVVDVVFVPADSDETCFTPLDLTHLAAVVEGTAAVYGRQEWALRYHLDE